MTQRCRRYSQGALIGRNLALFVAPTEPETFPGAVPVAAWVNRPLNGSGDFRGETAIRDTPTALSRARPPARPRQPRYTCMVESRPRMSGTESRAVFNGGCGEGSTWRARAAPAVKVTRSNHVGCAAISLADFFDQTSLADPIRTRLVPKYRRRAPVRGRNPFLSRDLRHGRRYVLTFSLIQSRRSPWPATGAGP